MFGLFRKTPALGPAGHYPTYLQLGDHFLPLVCDEDRLTESIAFIADQFQTWYIREVKLFMETHPASHTSLPIELRKLNLLGLSRHPDVLERLLQDPPEQTTALHFYELLAYLHQITAPLLLSVGEARYYYHLIYTIRSITLQEAIAAHQKLPWLWLLSHYQRSTENFPLDPHQLFAGKPILPQTTPPQAPSNP